MTSFCKNTTGTRDVWILDLTRTWDYWKVGPHMKFHHWNPHTLVADGKLYVLGGLDGFKLKGDMGWMEVFDTDLGKWTSLPNPSSQINSDHMKSAPATKEIIVSKPSTSTSINTGDVSQGSGNDDGYESPSLGDDEPNLEHWDEFEDDDFFTYNISDRSWNDLKYFVLNVNPNAGRIAVTSGEGHYWCYFVDDNQYKCLLHAYLLEKNMWFKHIGAF